MGGFCLENDGELDWKNGSRKRDCVLVFWCMEEMLRLSTHRVLSAGAGGGRVVTVEEVS